MALDEPFYDKLMPIFGFDISKKVSTFIKEHDLYVVEYLHSSFDFGICSPRTQFQGKQVHRRKPGAFLHLAFRAESREEVDALHGKIKEIGARIVHAPRIFPGHSPYCYACFLKTPTV